LCRDAGKAIGEPGPREHDLVKRVRALAHIDDRRRRAAYYAILNGSAPSLSPGAERLAEMLFFSLFPDGGGFDSPTAGLAALMDELVVDEMRQVIDISFDSSRRSTYPLDEIIPELVDVPLSVHASYSREEVLVALGFASLRRTPSTMREGVAWCEPANADAFLITLKKTETDYSPSTMYRDFALSPELFHWESQSTTSSTSRTGQRYIHHRERGSHILLFVREAKTNVSHEGDRPMAITWRLRRPMPTEVFMASRAAVA
jgi:hypothetical protein